MALRIEFEKPVQDDPCSCCGGRTTRLTRFVYLDDHAHAVYYGSFSDMHPDQGVNVAISLGNWGEGSEPKDRVAFALQIRSTESEFQVGVVDAKYSPWQDADILGRMLDRSEALKHPWLQEVFHLTDHIVMEDNEVRRHLLGESRRPPKKK
jgi:hypothetical protein